MFLVFSLSVFVFSLIATLFIAVLVTVFFTTLMVGIAFLFLLPVLFGTTFGASFLFFWGLVGYYILTWFNGGESPMEEGTVVGDRFHSVTGGRLRYLTDGGRKEANGGDRTKIFEAETGQHGVKPPNGLGDNIKVETY
jgi:energy-coupling factor transporter transmembrane protein EcfT